MPMHGAIKTPQQEQNCLATPSAQGSQEFRRHVGQISRQSGVFFAGTIFTAIAGYAFKVYLARKLGAEALGIYALGMTVVGLFGIFGGLGLNWAALKFPSSCLATGRMEDLRAFLTWSVLILIGISGLLAGCILFTGKWISVSFYHSASLASYLPLFAALLFLGQLTNFAGQLLTGYKAIGRRTIITNFVGAALGMGFSVILLLLRTGLRGYVYAQIASGFVVLALLIRTARQLTPSPAKIALKKLRLPHREMFSFATAAFAMDIVGFIYTQTDKVILGSRLNVKVVGIYAVAATMVAFIPVVLQSVNQIFSPTISELHATGQKGLLDRLFQLATKWVIGLTLPLAAAVIIFSRPIMRIFGPEFESGWLLLVVGSLGQVVNCATGSVGYLLLMSGNERRLIRIQAVTAVLTVGLCFAMVLRWGVTGAAIAAALSNAGSNIWLLVEVKRVLGLFPYNRSYLRLILPTLLSVAAGLGLKAILPPMGATVGVLILGTMLIYGFFLCTAFLQGLDMEDRLIANAIWTQLRDIFHSLRLTRPLLKEAAES